MSIFNADYQNHVQENHEEDSPLFCTCGHSDEEHSGEEDSSLYPCDECFCADYIHNGEPVFDEPVMVTVRCEICDREFTTLDEGKECTATKCGCDNSEILF